MNFAMTIPRSDQFHPDIEADFARVSAELTKATADRSDMALAMQLATTKDQHPDAAPGFYARADRYIEKAKRYPKRLLDDLEELNDHIDRLKLEFSRLHPLWEQLQAAKTDAIAEPLVQRHRLAVQKIAAGLDEMSAALAEEESVRLELAKSAPFPSSRLLPDMATSFGEIRLSDKNSTATAWVKAARARGFI